MNVSLGVENLLEFGDDLRVEGGELLAPVPERLMAQVGLLMNVLEQRPEELSVGQAQRLCLARTLATRPEVLLLDEPTSALDPTARLGIERLVGTLRRDHTLTSIFVAHDLEQARRLGGQAAVLVQGRIIEEGPIGAILDHPTQELTRRFVTGNLEEGG